MAGHLRFDLPQALLRFNVSVKASVLRRKFLADHLYVRIASALTYRCYNASSSDATMAILWPNGFLDWKALEVTGGLGRN